MGLAPLFAGDTDFPRSLVLEAGAGETFSGAFSDIGLADLRLEGVRLFSSVGSVLPGFEAGLGVSLLRVRTLASYGLNAKRGSLGLSWTL